MRGRSQSASDDCSSVRSLTDSRPALRRLKGALSTPFPHPPVRPDDPTLSVERPFNLTGHELQQPPPTECPFTEAELQLDDHVVALPVELIEI